MALNLSPYLPHSTARDLVMASTPDLAAALGTTNPDPLWAYVVVMDTTLAPVPVRICTYLFIADTFYRSILGKMTILDT